ncbi:hypothetical protein AVHY2522_23660 [Acidovorax sp. SUPP2522]|uniref:hypothetical protein n=1 Tax=unclassified Acidovorax TaxID=2684926 RepID=UPI002348F3C0|nr:MULTISPECIES: hypothetical protein [unclassified Acidovorax]WCM99941.1 hypothetical protein M5C96_11385 [Acidovorax sp. GBBC 1281]GKT19759.1 hypothetical protein AVHY2522_23660 [Acidovorax sp. SUPP2522]
MSATDYTPRENSVAWKIVQFLHAHRDHQLDADLIAAKCDCDRRNVHTLLGPAVQAGLLTRAEDLEAGELVYRAGQKGPQAMTAAPGGGFHGWLERKGKTSAEGSAARRAEATTPPPATTAPTPQRRKPAPRFTMDARTVPIEKGVPLPSGVKVMDWSPLLEKLEPGDSFLVPYAARSSISTAVKAYKDATGKTLTTRTLDTGIRVWRTE